MHGVQPPCGPAAWYAAFLDERFEPMAKLRIYLTHWCPDCRKALKFLDSPGIAYDVVDVDESEEGEELVLRVNDGRRKVPTIEVDGRYFAVSPYDRELLAKELKDLQVEPPSPMASDERVDN